MLIRRIIRKLLKLCSRPNHRKQIVEKGVVDDNPKSYAGGTLIGQKMLITGRLTVFERDTVLETAQREKLTIETSYNGFYRKIIVHTTADDSNPDCIKNLYYALIEADNHIDNSIGASICAMFKIDDSLNQTIAKHQFMGMIHGLAFNLAKKGTFCNGIVYKETVPFQKVIDTAIFLSSRYGQVLTGEVIQME